MKSNYIITETNGSSQVEIFFDKVDATPVQTVLRFTGRYPRKVGHTCQLYGVAESESYGTQINLYSNRHWRNSVCEGCLYDRVMRIYKQVETELYAGVNLYSTVIDDTRVLRRIQERYSRTKRNTHEFDIYKTKDILISKSCVPPLRYVTIPLSTGYFTIHNQVEIPNSAPLPQTYGQLFTMIRGGVTNMLSDGRIRSSQGFGREYQHMLGYGITPATPSKDKLTFTPTNVLMTALQPYRKGKKAYDISLLTLLYLLEEHNVPYKLVHTAG